ncbi:MAG: DUF47 family protein [Synergistaceae bacterium]|nr:DUF47 family protein [Synergistaceae bacterium]
MSGKRDAFYFENFICCTALACEAAQLLENALTDFDPERMEERLREMHNVEHAADEKKHELLNVLAKAFITPIEREDIIQLSQNIDEMTDKIEDVLLRIYCNNIRSVRPDALPLVALLIRCCGETRRLVEEFANFRYSKKLHDHIVHINTMEEEADRLFISGMRSLHTTSDDPVTIITWREIYIYLEKCVDACEHVADTIEGVVMKNS